MKKKKYIVLPRNGKVFENGLTTGKGHRKFKKSGAMWITDEAEAREIEHEYGMKGKRQVAVTTDQQYEWSANNEGGNGTKMDNIHNYTFQGVDMEKRGGNERVKVKTVDGYTFMSQEQAEELGYEIIPQKREKRLKAEVKNVDYG